MQDISPGTPSSASNVSVEDTESLCSEDDDYSISNSCSNENCRQDNCKLYTCCDNELCHKETVVLNQCPNNFGDSLEVLGDVQHQTSQTEFPEVETEYKIKDLTNYLGMRDGVSSSIQLNKVGLVNFPPQDLKSEFKVASNIWLTNTYHF